MLRKVATLLICLTVTSVLTFVLDVEASSINVTDEPSYVKVENDYYIANISKTFGGIEHFYIKPHTTKSIVTTYLSHDVLGLHELGWTEAGTGGGIVTQGANSFTEHFDTSVIYHDSSTVVVRSLFRLFYESYWSANITEWRTFYADKPWFVVTFTTEFLCDGQFWVEHQICFMYDKDYPTHYRILNDNGTIIRNADDIGHHYSTKYLEKYMWVYVHNSTDDTGIGHILIDAYPRSLMTYWGWWFGTHYKEWQLTLDEFRMGLPQGSKQTVTYINYVANNETVIDSFASDLYKADHKVTQGTSDYMPVLMNNQNDPKLGGVGKLGSFQLIPWSNALYADYYVEGAQSKREIRPYYTNSSGFYKIVPATWTFPSHYWNSTYANLTMRAEKHNVRFDITAQAWIGNDAVEVKLEFTSLDSLNITDIYVDFSTYPDYTFWQINELTADIALMNASNSQIHWMYDYGHAFKNLTAYASRTTGSAELKYYLLDTEGNTEYSSGQSWTLTLKVHKFIRTTEDAKLFQATDFLDTGSDLVNFNHQFWIPLPFPEVPSEPTFYMDHFGQQYGQLIESTFSEDELTVRIAGESEKTLEWQIYCGDKGKPHKVFINNSEYKKNDHWTYDPDTRIFTFSWTYTSIATVQIRWKRSAHDLLNLHIKVTKDGHPTDAIINLNGENRSIFFKTLYQLPYGTYEISAYYEDERQTKEISLYANTKTGFNFGTGKKRGKIP